MEIANITEITHKFANPLSKRGTTRRIIIHHTGGAGDSDLSAQQIHRIHLANGWAGIGYHFVIRKNGTIERGRPIWAIGAHAADNNYDSIGIQVCGQFNYAYPTKEQIEMTAMLIANITQEYDITPDRKHIIGHDESYSGVGKSNGIGCPGLHLQDQLGIIVGKANFYRYIG